MLKDVVVLNFFAGEVCVVVTDFDHGTCVTYLDGEVIFYSGAGDSHFAHAAVLARAHRGEFLRHMRPLLSVG